MAIKSFCIKTNNEEIINYLLKNLDASYLEDIYFVSKEFKSFKNVIIHYLGKNIDSFLAFLSDIITDCILLYYESNIIRKIINYNYFYFDDFEKKIIEQNCYDYIIIEENNTLKYRKDEIFNCVMHYINYNKSMILDGFVNFRLEEYMNTLEEIVDYSVQQYVIEKEYNEFINLLKLYIDSKEPTCNCVHLICTNDESILLNEDKHVINLEDNIFNAQYLSDISFSSNDFALNALLTLLPKKIEIHLCSNYNDEFIDTLKLIFGMRIFICTDCNICKTYKILNNAK